MKSKETLLFTALNVTTDFASNLVPTGIQKRGSDFKDEVDGSDVADGICFVSANVTGITGTGMDVDVVTEINGVDVIVGSFTTFSAISNQTIKIEGCPSHIKVVGTENAITDFDAVFACTRLVN